MERYLAHFARAGKRPTILFSPGWTPAVDMFETDEAVVVIVDLAGVDAQHTEVHTEPHLLTIRGLRNARQRGDQSISYHALEIPYGHFERTLRLPPGIDADGARATYDDGVLEIVLPKTQAREVHITIQD